MALKEQTVELDGTTYTVREATMRAVLPILEGPEEQRGVGLMRVSVYNGGAEPLGDKVLDLGFRDYQRLQNVVAEVYGFGELGNV